MRCRSWGVIARKNPSEQLIQLTEAQAGVVSSTQLTDLEAPEGALKRWRQRWTRMGPGLYCVTPPTFTSWCWAGLVRAGAGSAISGLAALHLDELTTKAPEQITVWHPGRHRIEAISDATVQVVFRRGKRAGEGDPTRTKTLTALLDAGDETDEDALIAVVTRAISQNKVTAVELREEITSRRRVHLRRLMLDLCEEAATGVESVLEWRFLTEVIHAHDLPEPVRQESLLAQSRSDNVWQEFAMVAELDGHLGHEDKFRDMQRDNRLSLEGYLNLRYGWHDVTHRPCATASQIARALQLRGWTGVRRRCRRCRRERVS